MNFSRPLKELSEKGKAEEKSQALSNRKDFLYFNEEEPYRDEAAVKSQKDRLQLETELGKLRQAGITKGKLTQLKEACARAWVELMERTEEADYQARKLWRIKKEREFDEQLKREQRAHEEASAKWIKVAEQVQKRNQMLPMLQILRKQNDSLLKSLSG